MKTLKTVVIVLALIFIVFAVAEAVELYSAPLFILGTDWIACDIVNVGTTNKTIRLRIYNYVGMLVGDSDDMVLEPGNTYDGRLQYDGFFYCRFTVSGSKTGVRAAAKVTTNNGSDKVAIAVE
jgi:hypothetical protein